MGLLYCAYVVCRAGCGTPGGALYESVGDAVATGPDTSENVAYGVSHSPHTSHNPAYAVVLKK